MASVEGIVFSLRVIVVLFGICDAGGLAVVVGEQEGNGVLLVVACDVGYCLVQASGSVYIVVIEFGTGSGIIGETVHFVGGESV